MASATKNPAELVCDAAEPVRKRARSSSTIRRRAEILTAALGLLDEKKFEDVTMTEVAKAARVSRSALYFHFSNTQDIYRAASRQIVTDIWDKIWEESVNYSPQNIEDLLDMIIDVAMEFVNSYPAVGKTFIGTDLRFHILGWAEDYSNIVLSNIRALAHHFDCDIPAVMDGSFRTISLAISVTLRDDYQRSGMISKEQVDKLKRILRHNLALAEVESDEEAARLPDHDAALAWACATKRVLQQDSATIHHIIAQIDALLGYLADTRAEE